MNPSQISVTIIVKNAQSTISECLESVIAFDEVVLLDNGSDDKTLAIAKKFANVRIYHSEFIGFGALKNLAISKAKNDWILSLDSDEVLESATLKEIQSLEIDSATIVAMPRKNLYAGEWIKACGWYPDFVKRLFNRKATKFNDNIVHESVMTKDNMRQIYLKNGLKHYAYKDISGMINKMNTYTTYSAQEKFQAHKKIGISACIARFFLTFIKNYIFRKGFLYGYKGFIVALLIAEGAFYRYVKLYELNKQKDEIFKSGEKR